jgi:hydrogenase expression/formation protein HypC
MCLGIPGRIAAITDASRQMAMAEVSGVRREVSLAPVADRPLADLVGEWALIHVGFAMAVIDEHEAAETLKALEGLGEAQETLEAMAEGARALEERASGATALEEVSR